MHNTLSYLLLTFCDPATGNVKIRQPSSTFNEFSVLRVKGQYVIAVIEQCDACYKLYTSHNGTKGRTMKLREFRGGFQNKGPSSSILKDKLETSSWKWDKQ